MFSRFTTTALGGAAVLALSACASGPTMAPFSQADLPAAVQVPAGHRVAFETAAAGDITYQCQAKKNMAGQYEWVFMSPDAGLKGRKGERLSALPRQRFFSPLAST